MIKVVVQGQERFVEPGLTAGALLGDERALAARVNGRLVDLSFTVVEDATIEPVYFESREGRDIFWHSASHLMAQAVKQLYPEAKVTIGPAVPEGFYYDFDVPQPFTEKDLGKIEVRMQELAAQKIPIVHKYLPRDEALKLFSERGESYKLEIINEIPDEQISVYEQGDFVDLCRGPHVPDTGRIKAVKLLSVAGAYWRGDERNRMLSRIYGVAFPDEALLKEHLDRLEEAKRRDHRKLGPALDLFSFHEEAGAGLVFWHPKGATVRRLIQQYWEREHLAAGYQLVVTPHIARSQLWHQSGHYDYYRENMYILPVENEEYVLKPMNCPGHILIYRTKVHSYRDLPLRMAEWGTVYRYERSGVLHGMMRVRGFTQDDAHIFCTREQVEEEIYGVVALALKMLRQFGFERFSVSLSVRDPKHPENYLGTDEQWQVAEGSLIKALNRLGLDFVRAEGEAVFYGPKIDIHLADSLGREFQCSTCQFDFNLGGKFDVYYMDEHGQHLPVYLVHRTVLGSIERFTGILVEHYGGAFPVWLAPVQARVMTVTEKENGYAQEVYEALRQAEVRVEIDLNNDKINYKIGEAERQKVPYMLVVGAREAEARTVALRRRGKGNLGAMPLEKVIALIKEEESGRTW
ncbi:MAG: threonine--tRNA ligase [candidate division WOR-3 bacterium]|uniref:Threonine--tRNA ligase n=1 Tax=candidate division WOR-3 bacterium TaxID=2052148 RepID=A0A7C1X5R5_UNCW3|nr:threonine--tRNA ligase [candidate division WOR-3 bacterium]